MCVSILRERAGEVKALLPAPSAPAQDRLRPRGFAGGFAGRGLGGSGGAEVDDRAASLVGLPCRAEERVVPVDADRLQFGHVAPTAGLDHVLS